MVVMSTLTAEENERTKHRKQQCFECGRFECCACSCGNSCGVATTIDQQAKRIESLERALRDVLAHPRWLSIGAENNEAEIRMSRYNYERCVAALSGGNP